MKGIIFSLYFLFLSVASFALWVPPINNYTTLNSYAGRQNWDIEQCANGWIYFANNEGLVEFNGLEWNKYSMDNNSIVRAVKGTNDGSIYRWSRRVWTLCT